MLHNPVLVLICTSVYTLVGLLVLPLGLYAIMTTTPENNGAV
ncbi:MAG: hypothetical protein WC343_05615 [Bacilli bacterium]|jgi:hypothetical protein